MDFYNISTQVKRILNWRLVRGVAELEILTKATYFMLIFVPILAGTWPAVRLYVNNHNEAVINSTVILETYVNKFDKSKLNLENYINQNIEGTHFENNEELSEALNQISKSSSQFSNDVSSFTSDYIPKTIEEPSLPWTWAAAFFASLFAVIAHLIYQLSSPEILRRFTLDEFVKDQKEDYSKHPSEASLEKAQNYLTTKQGLTENKFDEHSAHKNFEKLIDAYRNKDKTISLRPLDIASNLSLKELAGIQDFITNDSNSGQINNASNVLELVRNVYESKNEKIGGDLEKQKNMTVIERGARAEYIYWADRNLFTAFLTSLIYGIAIYIIFEIIIVQASSVVHMAGWGSWTELFRLSGKL
jgi:hypothetical protein